MDVSKLKGKPSWAIAPSSVGQTLGAGISVYYGILTLRIPDALISTFVGSAAVVVALLVVYGTLRALHRMKTLRAVIAGEVEASKESLSTSLREVASVPDLMFWMGLQNWAIGASSVAFATKLLTGAME